MAVQARMICTDLPFKLIIFQLSNTTGMEKNCRMLAVMDVVNAIRPVCKGAIRAKGK